MRVGLGYDIHRAKPGDHIWLGGVKVNSPFALDGHSDADVLLHAVTDAILGALALDDIGHHFPPSDPENKNRASKDFLAFAVAKMKGANYAIGNIDCNIICEEPRVASWRQQIRDSLASLLGVSLSQISVKGRTNEQLDAVGRKEAVACQAIVLLE